MQTVFYANKIVSTLDEDGKPISLAEQDLVAIKATMRLAFLVVKDEAFAVLKPAT